MLINKAEKIQQQVNRFTCYQPTCVILPSRQRRRHHVPAPAVA
jgi:hypothetical protein